MSPDERATSHGDRAIRRIELRLHKPWFALYSRVRPTIVIGGRGQPAQWGIGTWQVPADETVAVGVFLYNRMWRFGAAEFVLEPQHPPALVYTAPPLPFLPGRIRTASRSASRTASRTASPPASA